jgi:hypothetical protein
VRKFEILTAIFSAIAVTEKYVILDFLRGEKEIVAHLRFYAT